MSTKHYPYSGGSFDRIIFDGDGSVWVPESESAKLRELCWCLFEWERVGGTSRDWRELQDCARELGVDV